MFLLFTLLPINHLELGKWRKPKVSMLTLCLPEVVYNNSGGLNNLTTKLKANSGEWDDTQEL